MKDRTPGVSKRDPESFPIVRFKKNASLSAVNFSEMHLVIFFSEFEF